MTTPDDCPMTHGNNKSEQWHLNKSVPISLIATILVQCAVGIWWGASISAQVMGQEHRIVTLEEDSRRARETISGLDSRIIRIEERTATNLEVTRRIERLLEEGGMKQNERQQRNTLSGRDITR